MNQVRRPLDDPRDHRPINPQESLFVALTIALAMQPFVYLIYRAFIMNLSGESATFYDSITYKVLNIFVYSIFRLIPILMVLKLSSNGLKAVVIALVSVFWILDVLSIFDIFNIYQFLIPRE